MDQQETRQAKLFLGHYDIIQGEVCTSSVNNSVLIGHK